MAQKFPQLWVFKEKHGDNIYLVHSEEGKQNMFFSVLKERWNRKNYHWMEKDEDFKKDFEYIKKVIEKEAKKYAYTALNLMSDSEYEGFNNENFEEFK